MTPPSKPEKGKIEQVPEQKSPSADGAGEAPPAWAHGLKQLYDSVVDEPLPDSFKDLIEAFDDEGEPDEDAGNGKTP
ncbi:NepR family anti-sigma factor [Erythrobacter sp.]|uniref:NepR family anti-sigma factor n=1 Tax=Erythrobacter sp. TaxID=1042 RepID=UPI002EB20E9D|nr:NepR family anti-sigma factor [Erythrobacter sp.]